LKTFGVEITNNNVNPKEASNEMEMKFFKKVKLPSLENEEDFDEAQIEVSFVWTIRVFKDPESPNFVVIFKKDLNPLSNEKFKELVRDFLTYPLLQPLLL